MREGIIRRFGVLGALVCAIAPLWLTALPAQAQQACAGAVAVCDAPTDGAFPLIAGGAPAAVHVDAGEAAGVLRAAEDLQSDLATLGGAEGALSNAAPEGGTPIIVGTLDGSALIQDLVARGALDVADIEGEWEAFVQTVVENPLPGVDRALVIAGADMRGAIFGVYDLADRAGVSPWAWWADVPTPQRPDLYVAPGRRAEKPAVKYRGIFINDEAPALTGWADETFGGFNHQFYERVFELILRLKGNYLWPAMWGKAFYDDDPQNQLSAAEYGVVIGTTHHEPLMRAHVEWERYGDGAWDYTRNAERLRQFWRRGVERIGDEEVTVTLGMRGDGDMAMADHTATDLLETIVADQREIIADVTGRPAAETPQLWALYKEVQDYYDQGMEVPDDVTLLFADDNWGNIRRLPEPGAERPGGYGVYYHFDYVGGPRNYKWLNTSQIERVWEQMRLAHDYGATEIWIVNVGDIKPMEFPIHFFLDYAWDPDSWPLERLPDYSRQWAAEQFGSEQAGEIAELLDLYTKYNARRKPELLSPDTFSLLHHDEAERVLDQWRALTARADAVRAALPAEADDAFMQLVWFPIHASANLNELYIAAARNRLYAEQGRASSNHWADRVEDLFARDAELTRIYHEDIAGGRWDHMMSQTHIGYTYWQEPPENAMPEVTRAQPREGFGLAVEGDARAWPAPDAGAGEDGPALAFDRYGKPERMVEVFARGAGAAGGADWSASADWVSVRPDRSPGPDARYAVWMNWDEIPEGAHRATLVFALPDGAAVPVTVEADNPGAIETAAFVEGDGYVAMEAADYTRAVGGGDVEWRTIPNLGRTGDSVTPFPGTAPEQTPGGDAPRLEYDVYLLNAGGVEVEVTLAPTLDFTGEGALRYAVSIDGGEPVIVDVDEEASSRAWEQSVANAAHIDVTQHVVDAPGAHTVKLWMVDPAVVFQRVVVRTEEGADTYLGPPASRRGAESAASGQGGG